MSTHMASGLLKPEDLDGSCEEGVNEKLNVGAVVRLKSGGQEMTVSAIGMNCTIYCVWMDQTGFIQKESFPRVCLNLVDP